MFGFSLTPDAKYWRHLWSVQVLIMSALANGAAIAIPAFGGTDIVQNHPFAYIGVNMGLAVLGLAGRLVDQPNVPTD